mgnify:CR=1 FL=1|jgi:hypothetical protein
MQSKYLKQTINKKNTPNKYSINTYARSLRSSKYRQKKIPNKKKDFKPEE